MPITKIPKLPDNLITSDKSNNNAVTTGKINNGTVSVDDLASTLDLSSKTVTLPSDSVNFDREHFNISLLGFKMAVNENLTVFNLVDGVVDEFNDESGTDESEGSNDLYNSSCDYYINSTQPDGQSLSFSAGFSINSTTEPDTSSAGSNPSYASGTNFTYTVPSGVTSIDIKVWGAGSGGNGNSGGGGGFASGTLAVTPSQTIRGSAGEGGSANTSPMSPNPSGAFTGGGNSEGPHGGGAGGLAFVAGVDLPEQTSDKSPYQPQMYVVAGSGGVGYCGPYGGGGGGLTGCAGGTQTEQTNNNPSGANSGGGGDQEQGGQGSTDGTYPGQSGAALQGGNSHPQRGGGGGAGYFGGGGAGGTAHGNGAGGGGSSYYSHPQITSGTTEEASGTESGGAADPNYVSGTSEGQTQTTAGEDGYALITASLPATATTTTVISSAFATTSVPTSSRIVVFEEDIDSPTLNTDIIASISRDGGSTYTTATLSDSGYVTGSSGQRILTGQATISGQPSGQSMRWKLALANNQVKIHGVSLSWS